MLLKFEKQCCYWCLNCIVFSNKEKAIFSHFCFFFCHFLGIVIKFEIRVFWKPHFPLKDYRDQPQSLWISRCFISQHEEIRKKIFPQKSRDMLNITNNTKNAWKPYTTYVASAWRCQIYACGITIPLQICYNQLFSIFISNDAQLQSFHLNLLIPFSLLVLAKS